MSIASGLDIFSLKKLTTALALSDISGAMLRQRAPENAGDNDTRIDRHFEPVS